jgi:hypothetical protein
MFLQNAIAASLNYDKCLAQKGDARCAQYTKTAFVLQVSTQYKPHTCRTLDLTILVLCLCRLACQLDKALTNVGALLSNQVEGRVCTEIDPRLAKDQGGLHHALALPYSALWLTSGLKVCDLYLMLAKPSKMTSADCHAPPVCL